MSLRSLVLSAVAAVGAVIGVAAPAAAHPHVFVDARSQVVFDKEGRIVAVRQIWRFDDAFSAFASQGLDKNGDGILTVEELQPLAKVNVDSLKDYEYFTFLRVGGRRTGFKIPTEYWLQSADGYLTLFYTLNLMQPIKPDAAGVTLDVYDPGYFVDFQMVEKDPIVLENAPANCKASLKRKDAPDPATAAILGQIPASERELPANLKAMTSDLANRMTVVCP
jgi:ABC-type uncharacterized transport system substrate-binding protein